MKKALKQILITVILFSILLLPAAWHAEAAATTVISNGLFYMFQNLHSGKFMEVANGNVIAGANVQQRSYASTYYTPLIFCLDTAEDGISSTTYHRILPFSDLELCMDVDNAWDSNGANIKIFSQNPGYGAQSFKFISNGDGTFCIQPYLSSTRVLGVASSSTSEQANVQLVSFNSNDASQKWVLKRVWPADTSHYSMGWSYFFRDTNATTCTRVSQRFSNASSTSHYGLDIVGVSGTSISGKAIYSPCAGTVVGRGTDSTMGNYVIIRTAATSIYQNGLTIRLMHMLYTPEVAFNASVTKNTLLGYVGNTGTSTGAHLHVDINSKGYLNGSSIRGDLASAINPESFYPQIQFVYGLSASNTTYA